MDTDDDFRKLVDAHVVPYAFANDLLWKGRAQQACEVCEAIGAQLVRPWLARTKGTAGLDERTNRWTLGALRMASLTAFANSVPKPVIPLLWLSGDVSFHSHQFEWRPLFWDARRTNAAPQHSS